MPALLRVHGSKARGELEFGGVHLVSGRFDGEEGGAINFREFALLAGTRRPFDRERVALQRGGVAISFEGPGGDGLAALVLDAAEGKEWAGGRESGFFFKFALGGGEFVLAGSDLAFGKEPCAFVLLRPERSAEVDEENFQEAVSGSAHQETGALLRHGRTIHLGGKLIKRRLLAEAGTDRRGLYYNPLVRQPGGSGSGESES